MSYYIETARPAMELAADLLGGMAEDFDKAVSQATSSMGAVSWPMLMWACQDPYNWSLKVVRDANVDVGHAVSAVAEEIKQIVSVYKRLEELNEVK